MQKNPAQKLRTVLLYSAGHLGSATVFNRLVDSEEFDIVAVVKARAVPFSRKGARKLRRHLRKIGWRFGWLLFWQSVVQGLAFYLLRLIPVAGKRLAPGWALAYRRGIPIHRCRSINDEETLRFIASLEPDVLVSAYFTQILRKPAIEVPRLGVLNVHPGWLPAYRGAMVYFWVLKNGEDRGGVTVHWIDEGIDTGAILARRAFRIRRGWTQHKVLVMTAVIGSHLLRRVGRVLAAGQEPEPLAVPREEREAYYAMPQGEDFDAYFRRRRFFRIRDMFGYIWRRIRRRG
jgi:methionyl-tRNA formyltransferase